MGQNTYLTQRETASEILSYQKSLNMGHRECAITLRGRFETNSARKTLNKRSTNNEHTFIERGKDRDHQLRDGTILSHEIQFLIAYPPLNIINRYL